MSSRHYARRPTDFACSDDVVGGCAPQAEALNCFIPGAFVESSGRGDGGWRILHPAVTEVVGLRLLQGRVEQRKLVADVAPMLIA